MDPRYFDDLRALTEADDDLVFMGNDASSAVLRSCGFVQESVLTDDGRVGGKFLDRAMFAQVDRAMT